MDLFIVLLILHVLWMWIWSYCLLSPQRPDYICLGYHCYHYQQLPPHHQRPKLPMMTKKHFCIKTHFKQYLNQRIRNVLLTYKQSIQTCLVKAGKTVYSFQSLSTLPCWNHRLKIKVFNVKSCIKWTQSVIIVANTIILISTIRKLFTRLKPNIMVLHLNLSMRNNSIFKVRLESSKAYQKNKS